MNATDFSHIGLSPIKEVAESTPAPYGRSDSKLGADFSYSDEARADVDFPRHEGGPFAEIMSGLKSLTWPKQAPAIRAIFELNWSKLDKDQVFVLGRNIYQCADGGENNAKAIVRNLEAYFDKEGGFRGDKLKRKYLGCLLELQTVKKFAPSIAFINRELQPYVAYLPFIPATPPEVVRVDLVVRKSDSRSIKTLR